MLTARALQEIAIATLLAFAQVDAATEAASG